MKKFDFNAEDLEQEKNPAPRGRLVHGRCEVYGCPRDGHIYTSSWNCRYHAGKHGSNLAHITMILKNHGKEFDWYEHVLNATVTDFGMGEIAKQAPYGLEVHANESLKEYKSRMREHINGLLGVMEKIAA